MKLRVVFTAAAGLSLAACATLSGLDQITESDCAPDCAGDAEPDAAPEAGPSESSVPNVVDAASDAHAADGGIADVVSSSDSTAVSDATPDTPVSDSGPVADAAPDAVSDAGPDAVADAAPDAPPDACGTVYLSENFDGPASGWTLDSTWAVATTCAAPPAPQKGHPDPTVDHTTGKSGGVVGAYVCGNNPAGKTSPYAYATSPAVDVSGAQSVVLTFYRWLNTDSAGWMTSTVDVFDGSAWVNLYTNPTGSAGVVTDAAWTKVTYDVTAHKNAALRVRFGYAVVDAGVYSMSCWNVDDVTLSASTCP